MPPLELDLDIPQTMGNVAEEIYRYHKRARKANAPLHEEELAQVFSQIMGHILSLQQLIEKFNTLTLIEKGDLK